MTNTAEILDWLVFTGRIKEDSENKFRGIIDRELMRGKTPEQIISVFAQYAELESVTHLITEMWGPVITEFHNLAQTFAIGQEVIQKFLEKIDSIYGFQAYATAGRPYGKSIRGWKKWKKVTERNLQPPTIRYVEENEIYLD